MENKKAQAIRHKIWIGFSYFGIGLLILLISPIIILIYTLMPIIVIARWAFMDNSFKKEWNMVVDELYSNQPYIILPKFTKHNSG
jgi:uncharacterized membrane protein YukC